MYLIVTRTFPPEVGGMQNLMYGLAKSLSENVMIKVFADQYPNQYNFDKELSFSIERVSGPKIFKKYRKANLVNTYLENNKKVKAIISDHWKSLENINTEVKKICLIHSKEINHKKGSFINKRLVKILNNCQNLIIASSRDYEYLIKRNLKNFSEDPNLILEAAYDNKELKGLEDEWYAKLIFIYPGREGPTALDGKSSSMWKEEKDMSGQMLTKVKRQNKIMIEFRGSSTVSRTD